MRYRIAAELVKIAEIVISGLEEYEKKRDFEKTPEPTGKEKLDLPDNFFVIQLHKAKKAGKHFDLRLREGNVLKSWAIPKAKLPKKGERFLAIQTEDHPLAYGTFEGEIPEGQYGAGTVEIYCTGEYETLSKGSKKWKFELDGDNCSGIYTLVHIGDKKWLIISS